MRLSVRTFMITQGQVVTLSDREYNFLLAMLWVYFTVSKICGDIDENRKFLHPCILRPPPKVLPSELYNADTAQKSEMMDVLGGEKSLTIWSTV